jgi:hypothetical protein
VYDDNGLRQEEKETDGGIVIHGMTDTNVKNVNKVLVPRDLKASPVSRVP